METEMRVPQIIVECPVLLPSVRVGVLNLLNRLEAKGKCGVRFVKTFDVVADDIKWCDIFISVRGCETMSLEIAKAAKKYGRFVIYYLDDDLLNLPDTAISSDFLKRESNRQNMKDLIGLCDVFWSSSPKIIEKYKMYGKNIRCFRCDIISEEFHDSEHSDVVTKILYAGSIDHSALVKKYIMPALERIAKEYGEKVEITLVGIDAGTIESERIKSYSFIKDYRKYRDLVENSGFDIGLGIIDTSEFYQCKYYNKFIEYTSIGAAGIYTDSYPYKYVVEHKRNGLLVENSVETWYRGIKLLIERPELRREYVQHARDKVKLQFSEKRVLEELLEHIPELVFYKAPEHEGKFYLKGGKRVYLEQRLKDYWKENKLMFVPNVLKAMPGVIKRYLEDRERN